MQPDELTGRIEILERWAKEHGGPERGKTSLNYPHTNVVYLDEDGLIPITLLPSELITETEMNLAIALALYYL